MLILVPIFLPYVDKLGISQIHFGILCIACLGIGIFLPPIGMGCSSPATLHKSTSERCSVLSHRICSFC